MFWLSFYSFVFKEGDINQLFTKALLSIILCHVTRDILTLLPGLLIKHHVKCWQRNKMYLEPIPSLWQNKPVELNIATPGKLVKIHLIALTACHPFEIPDAVSISRLYTTSLLFTALFPWQKWANVDKVIKNQKTKINADLWPWSCNCPQVLNHLLRCHSNTSILEEKNE